MGIESRAGRSSVERQSLRRFDEPGCMECGLHPWDELTGISTGKPEFPGSVSRPASLVVDGKEPAIHFEHLAFSAIKGGEGGIKVGTGRDE